MKRLEKKCDALSNGGGSIPATRRRFIAGGAAAIAAPYVITPAWSAMRQLRILCWEGYASKDWVAPFEKKFNAEVRISYAGSVDEMFAKMRGSDGRDFDVLSFDTSAFERYIQAKLIQPLDMTKIPNFANLAPAFQTVRPTMRGAVRYGLPFAWGSLPLVYDPKQFSVKPTSWEVMWDPKNAQKLIALDDANNNITLAAIVLGIQNPFRLTAEQFEAVKKKLIEQKRLLLTYYAGFAQGVEIFVQSDIKAMFSMGEPQVDSIRKKGVDAEMVIPKEGAIGWLDCWEVSAGARDTDLAFAWINACLDKSVGALLTRRGNYGNTTNESINIKNGFTYAKRLTFLEAPESFTKRVEIWNEVKASI